MQVKKTILSQELKSKIKVYISVFTFLLTLASFIWTIVQQCLIENKISIDEVVVLDNKISFNLTQLKDQQNDLICSLELKGIGMKFGEMVQRITDLEVANNSLKQANNSLKQALDKQKLLINQIANNVPKVTLYSYNTQDWKWITIPQNQQILTHPTSAMLKIEKKSIITFTLNGHLQTSGQNIQVLFLKNKQPIAERSQSYFYYSYFSQSSQFIPLSLVQETTVTEPDTYLFEVGLICNEFSKPYAVSMYGMGYTIKVQELPDQIIIP